MADIIENEENPMEDMENVEESIRRCRAVDVLFPMLLIGYIGLSILLTTFVVRAGIQLPQWSQYIINHLFILTPAVLYALIFRENVPRELSYRRLRLGDAVLSLLTGYAMVPMILLLANLSMLFVRNHVNENVVGIMQYPFLVQLLLIAVIPAFVEEFIFRGLFFHTYRKVEIVAGAVVSAFLFGIFHLNVNQFCYAVVMGIVFACLVEATGSMWSATLAHFAFNTYSIGITELLKVLENHLPSTGQVENITLADLPVQSLVMQLVVLAGVAVGFMALAIGMIQRLAVRNGRVAHFQSSVASVIAGIKKMLCWPVILTALVCMIYMIFQEL